MQIFELDLHPHGNLHRAFLQASAWLSEEQCSSDMLREAFLINLAQALL